MTRGQHRFPDSTSDHTIQKAVKDGVNSEQKALSHLEQVLKSALGLERSTLT